MLAPCLGCSERLMWPPCEPEPVSYSWPRPLANCSFLCKDPVPERGIASLHWGSWTLLLVKEVVTACWLLSTARLKVWFLWFCCKPSPCVFLRTHLLPALLTRMEPWTGQVSTYLRNSAGCSAAHYMSSTPTRVSLLRTLQDQFLLHLSLIFTTQLLLAEIPIHVAHTACAAVQCGRPRLQAHWLKVNSFASAHTDVTGFVMCLRSFVLTYSTLLFLVRRRQKLIWSEAQICLHCRLNPGFDLLFM